MTDTTQATEAPAQSVNGAGPVPAADPAAEEMERADKYLGVLMAVAGAVLLAWGVNRYLGDPLGAAMERGRSDAGG